MSTRRYNIAVLGKTGVGKSTLVNVLVGQDVAQAGVGRPVTDVGFFEYPVTCAGIPVSLFDSWGIEAGRAEEWKRALEGELARRSPASPVDGWFHTVIFCVGSGGSRVEDFELDLMRLLEDGGYRVLVVLTKADQASEDDVAALKNVVNSRVPNARVVPVCSVEKKRLDGSQVRPFGVDDLRAAMVSSFWEAVVGRLPQRISAQVCAKIDGWAISERALIDQEAGAFGARNLAEGIQTRAKALLDHLQAEDGRPGSYLAIANAEFKEAAGLFVDVAPAALSSMSDGEALAKLTKVQFPGLRQAGRIAVGSLVAILSPTLLGLAGWIGIREWARRDLHQYVDGIVDAIKQAVRELEPEVAAELRKRWQG